MARMSYETMMSTNKRTGLRLVGGQTRQEVKMTLVNLTAHRIVIFDSQDGNINVITIEPSGSIARVAQIVEADAPVDGIPVVRSRYGEVTGLPDPQPGTYYIVSAMVAQAVAGRPDVLSPDTGPDSALRDEEGRITGVRRLMRIG
jgi:hypothetical protein